MESQANLNEVRIWSKAYCPNGDTDPYTISVNRRMWERCMRDEEYNRIFLCLKNPLGNDWFAPMGNPVDNNDDDMDDIYVPLWMIDSGGLTGDGEIIQVDIMDREGFPEATRLVFRVIDSAFYSSEVKEELERALSSLGVIRRHTILRIPLSSLDGFNVDVFVSETEPANVVLCHGEEIPVEFEEPLDQISPPRVPTPPPILQNPVPSLPSMLPLQEQPSKFIGQGYTLGSSSNQEGPAWRRSLPPPPRK